MLVGTRLDSGAGPQEPEPHAVPVGGDEALGCEGDEAGEEKPAEEEQEQDEPEAAEEVDVQAHVAAALTRIMAAACPPPDTGALEEEDQRRVSGGAQDAMEHVEELEIVGVKEAHEVGPQEMGVADEAGPKTGEVETCMQWAMGWCMRADTCRYAHPQPPVPQGVPQDLLLILQAMARVGAPSLSRSQSLSRSHATLMREVVEEAQGGGLSAVAYAVACEGRTEWAVALPCGMAALLNPFPMVPWRDMVAVQEANLGWVCTWHTHPAGMDPREWQAKAVVTYLSCSLLTAPGTWA